MFVYYQSSQISSSFIINLHLSSYDSINRSAIFSIKPTYAAVIISFIMKDSKTTILRMLMDKQQYLSVRWYDGTNSCELCDHISPNKSLLMNAFSNGSLLIISYLQDPVLNYSIDYYLPT